MRFMIYVLSSLICDLSVLYYEIIKSPLKRSDHFTGLQCNPKPFLTTVINIPSA